MLSLCWFSSSSFSSRRVVIIFILSDVSAVATASPVFLGHPGSLHLQFFVDDQNQRHVEELRVFVHQLPGIGLAVFYSRTRGF